MSDAKPQSAPSIEEILASINHLIAEDRKCSEPARRPAIEPAGSLHPLTPASVPRPREAAAGHLVSAATSETTAAAFAQLPALSREHDGDVPLGDGHTLQDAVRDGLRPLLQAWLDDHLPGIVERLVREEIARIAGEAGVR